MVTSYTALRTLIRHTYNKSAVSTSSGLIVPHLTRAQCRPQDIVCYECREIEGKGVLFTLDSIGVQKTRSLKPLPTTLNNFLSACIKKNISIQRQITESSTTPQLIAQELGTGELILNTSSHLANYCTIDIVLPEEESERVLCKVNYIKLEDGRYRVLLPQGTQPDISLSDLLDLLYIIVTRKDEDWKWKQWGRKEVEEMIQNGMTELLVTPKSQDNILEEGIW